MNRFCSIFSQILQLFARLEFQEMVRETKAERHARGLTCWTQFVAMLFCQLGRAHSLREICGGLAWCEGKLTHLGIRVPKRSTLSYANEHRPRQLYEVLPILWMVTEKMLCPFFAFRTCFLTSFTNRSIFGQG